MEDKIYYLYRHIRLDKNEPFYIGQGTKDTKQRTRKRTYARSFSTNRNRIWKRIVEKTEYRVEILYESHDKCEIDKKEKYFIKLYGRISLNNGILSNLADGGDGHGEFNLSQEARDLLTREARERVMTGENWCCKKLYVYNKYTGKLLYIFPSMRNAARNLNLSVVNIRTSMKIYQSCNKDLFFSNEFLGEETKVEYKIITTAKIVSSYDKNGNKIKTYESLSEASKELGITSTCISSVCRNKTYSAGGLIWSYGDADLIKVTPGEIYKREGKSVSCYDSNGVKIKSFESLTHAANFYKLNTGRISEVCKGYKRKAAGMFWAYGVSDTIIIEFK